ncbi:hypothetical protein [Rhodococcus sp. NPDC059234]|uniref:hypothetical protein n=1 Tax=Rhodococcus sp. NPDC059234 TaxID=3346781 RepID=UPI0036712598
MAEQDNGRVRAGTRPDAWIGPMTIPTQSAVVRRHVLDAGERGGRAVVGGPDPVGEKLIRPTAIAFEAVPSLPFGGVGQSRSGRIHGPDGPREFTFSTSVACRRVPAMTSFARTATTDKVLTTLTTVRHGSG